MIGSTDEVVEDDDQGFIWENEANCIGDGMYMGLNQGGGLSICINEEAFLVGYPLRLLEKIREYIEAQVESYRDIEHVCKEVCKEHVDDR